MDVTQSGKAPILQLEHVSKWYGNTVALDNVSLSCYAGEIHAIIGENGAGKSTLIKILSGVISPDQGEIIFNGEKVNFTNANAATAKGVAAIFQELSLIPKLTVYENIYLANEICHGSMVDYAQMKKKTAELLQRLEFDIDPDALVGELSLEEKQLVEIAKAIRKDSSIIIFDEATSALDAEQVKKLFKLIKRLKQEGKTILFISHRMGELEEIADCGSVFRDAKHIMTFQWGTVGSEQIVDWIVGDKVKAETAETTHIKNITIRKDLLCIRHLCSGNVLNDINLTIQSGEILGIAGLKGHGQSEFLYSLFGAYPITSGEITLENKVIHVKTPRQMIKNGVALVPEERKTEGLILTRSVLENIALMTLDKRKRFGFIRQKDELSDVKNIANMMHIKLSDPNIQSGSLSGGNQQKVVVGKVILTNAKVLLLADPTRGIDIGAKMEMYRIIQELAAKGVAIIFYSTEMSEMVQLCDRIAVFKSGTIAKILEGDDINEHAIIQVALGIGNGGQTA